MNNSAARIRVPLKRLLTSPLRALPDYLILGGIRCGTTSLYNYLIQHPLVAPALRKEMHYFNTKGNHSRGSLWYRASFSRNSALRRQARAAGNGMTRALTGEGTPSYLMDPEALSRIARLVPNVKLIVLLRHPVDRAYSNYFRAVSKGSTDKSFEQVVQNEFDVIESNEILSYDRPYVVEPNRVRRAMGFLGLGLYAFGIQCVRRHFAPEQVHVERTGNLFAQPADRFAKILEFLGLPSWTPTSFQRYNASTRGAIDPQLRAQLLEFYRPHNRHLFDLLGREFNWHA